MYWLIPNPEKPEDKKTLGAQTGGGGMRKTISRYGERVRRAKREKGSEYFQIAVQTMFEGRHSLKLAEQYRCCIAFTQPACGENLYDVETCLFSPAFSVRIIAAASAPEPSPR